MTMIAPSILHEPGSPAYEDARVLFNSMITTRPRYVARCASADDVVEALAFAAAQGLEVSVRAGGHAVTGRALCEGVVLDVRGIDFVEVDPARRGPPGRGGATLAQPHPAPQGRRPGGARRDRALPARAGGRAAARVPRRDARRARRAEPRLHRPDRPGGPRL